MFCGVPTLYAAIAPKSRAGARSRRRCAAASPRARRCPRRSASAGEGFAGVDILDGVGSTEMLHIFLSNRPGEVVYGTSGVAAPGYDVRLVDEHGSDVAEGEIGELLVRGPIRCDGLLEPARQSRATFRGPLDAHRRQICEARRRTLPLLRPHRRHVQGQRHLGRALRGRAALIAHPGCWKRRSSPTRDADGLEKPQGLRRAEAGRRRRDSRRRLEGTRKERIGKWKYPRWIVIVQELPKTATGKIQRYKLKET